MNPQGKHKLILVPADQTIKAEPGQAGTPAAGDWVWLHSPQDWDVGPFEVASEAGAEFRERAERAEAALRNALEGLEEMLPYVPEFFRNKWDLDTYVTRAKNALAVTAGEEGAGP